MDENINNPVKPVNGNPGPVASGSASLAVVAERKQRKPRSAHHTATGAAGGEIPAAKTVTPEEALRLEKLFDEKNFRGLVKMPLDVALAVTGHDTFKIDRNGDENVTLAVTGSTAAREFMSTDPKWVALSLFAFAVLNTYGSRLLIYLADRKKEKEKALAEFSSRPGEERDGKKP